MKAKNPLKKLTLLKTTIAYLNNEQMTTAKGGSCGGFDTMGCKTTIDDPPPPPPDIH